MKKEIIVLIGCFIISAELILLFFAIALKQKVTEIDKNIASIQSSISESHLVSQKEYIQIKEFAANNFPESKEIKKALTNKHLTKHEALVYLEKMRSKNASVWLHPSAQWFVIMDGLLILLSWILYKVYAVPRPTQ